MCFFWCILGTHGTNTVQWHTPIFSTCSLKRRTCHTLYSGRGGRWSCTFCYMYILAAATSFWVHPLISIIITCNYNRFTRSVASGEKLGSVQATPSHAWGLTSRFCTSLIGDVRFAFMSAMPLWLAVGVQSEGVSQFCYWWCIYCVQGYVPIMTLLIHSHFMADFTLKSSVDTLVFLGRGSTVLFQQAFFFLSHNLSEPRWYVQIHSCLTAML